MFAIRPAEIVGKVEILFNEIPLFSFWEGEELESFLAKEIPLDSESVSLLRECQAEGVPFACSANLAKIRLTNQKKREEIKGIWDKVNSVQISL